MAIANVARRESLHPAPVFRALVTNLVDYAGLFPPAGLTMPEAVRNYDVYLKGEMNWMLGRFIVPASRLRELELATSEIEPDRKWRLSCIVGDDPRAGLREVESFNDRNSGVRASVDTIEVHLPDVELCQDLLPHVSKNLTTYVEVPLNTPTDLLRSLGKSGARAKIRTGGLIPSAIPSTRAIAGFLANCAAADTEFKATAGLHHPLRSLKPLTYKPDAPRTKMHGFLNLFLAAAFARHGASAADVTGVMDCEEAQCFSFEENEARWNDLAMTTNAIHKTRQQFAMSFGSCSFEEPVEDLRHLHLL
ncbi:MAG: hypothetical protein ACREQ5_07280 [Candidatus Dormibacteria bacterium]